MKRKSQNVQSSFPVLKISRDLFNLRVFISVWNVGVIVITIGLTSDESLCIHWFWEHRGKIQLISTLNDGSSYMNTALLDILETRVHTSNLQIFFRYQVSQTLQGMGIKSANKNKAPSETFQVFGTRLFIFESVKHPPQRQ